MKAKVEKTKTVKSTTKADAKVVEDAATKTPSKTPKAKTATTKRTVAKKD